MALLGWVVGALSAPRGRKCSVCRKPVAVNQGSRHLVCSPICDVCFNPIPSTDVDATRERHSFCKPKGGKGRRSAVESPTSEMGLL